MRWRSLVLWLGVCRCATPAAPPPTTLAEALVNEGEVRPALDVALERFVEVSAAQRKATHSGAPMPDAQAQAWADVLTQLDVLLAQPEPNLLDLVKSRLTLESELDATTGSYGDVPAALAERIPKTLRALSAQVLARSPKPPAVDPAHFRWPTTPVIVTSPWGDRVHPIHGELRFHAGVDLAGERAQPIHAAAKGTVVFSGWNGAHGKQIELQHDAHLTTRYSHLMSLLVAPGRTVKRGEVIGLVGQTGQATGPHLHFELRIDGESVDPESRLPAPPEETHAQSDTR